MKIAVIFSGFFRTFEVVKNSLSEHILKNLQCDVFFNAPKTYYALPQNEISEYHHILSQHDKTINQDVIDFFGDKLKAFELRDYNSQHYIDIINQNNVAERNEYSQYAWRILSQMHSISLSVSLFKKYINEHQINYDLVILTRPDIKYYNNLDMNALDLDKINFPLHSIVEGRTNTVGACPSRSLNKPFNDQILIGTQNNILKFETIYDSVIHYAKEDICFNPETLQGIHCLKNNVDFATSDCILYELWRYEHS